MKWNRRMKWHRDPFPFLIHTPIRSRQRPWQVSSVQHERCNDFLTVTSLVSQKLSHPWLRGSQRPDNKTLSTFPSRCSSISCSWSLIGLVREVYGRQWRWVIFQDAFSILGALFSSAGNENSHIISFSFHSFFYFFSIFLFINGIFFLVIVRK